MAKDLTSPVGIARIATVVLGIVVMGIGLHSHFKSAWNTSLPLGGGKVHEYVCTLPYPKPCPKIAMEQYFVSMIIICFILSVLGLIASILLDLKSQPLKTVDLGYHAVAAILLLIAGIVYIVSAVQIDNLTKIEIRDLSSLMDQRQGIKIETNLRKDEKLAAGALTIIQALLYGVVSLLIMKQ